MIDSLCCVIHRAFAVSGSSGHFSEGHCCLVFSTYLTPSLFLLKAGITQTDLQLMKILLPQPPKCHYTHYVL